MAGALILSNIFNFQDKFRELPAANTILDITQVSYVDSAGIGCIVNAHVSCKNSGKSFLLVGPNDRVKAVLHHTRVDSVLTIGPLCPIRRPQAHNQSSAGVSPAVVWASCPHNSLNQASPLAIFDNTALTTCSLSVFLSKSWFSP